MTMLQANVLLILSTKYLCFYNSNALKQKQN